MYMYQEDQCPLPKFKGRGCISYQEDQCPLSKFKGEGAYHTKRTNVPPPLNSRREEAYHTCMYTKRTSAPHLNSQRKGAYHTKRTNAPHLNSREKGPYMYHKKRTNAFHLNSRGEGHIIYHTKRTNAPIGLNSRGEEGHIISMQEDQCPPPKSNTEVTVLRACSNS